MAEEQLTSLHVSVFQEPGSRTRESTSLAVSYRPRRQATQWWTSLSPRRRSRHEGCGSARLRG